MSRIHAPARIDFAEKCRFRLQAREFQPKCQTMAKNNFPRRSMHHPCCVTARTILLRLLSLGSSRSVVPTCTSPHRSCGTVSYQASSSGVPTEVSLARPSQRQTSHIIFVCRIAHGWADKMLFDLLAFFFTMCSDIRIAIPHASVIKDRRDSGVCDSTVKFCPSRHCEHPFWHLGQSTYRTVLAMAPHLSDSELDVVAKLRHLPMSTVLERLTKARGRRGVEPPSLRTVQRAINGKTFRRGATETRGRKKRLSPKNVRQLDKARKTLIKQAKGESEVHWKDVIKKARVPKVDPTTASRALAAAGFDIKARRPREKPLRTPEHRVERVQICKKWVKRPVKYFTDKVDLIMDNKKFEIPMTAAGKKFLRVKSVRFHLRTKAEGLKDGYTKPNTKRHRINTGGKVDVCAGIIGGKIGLWHYLPKKSWSGQLAADTYKGPIAKALNKHVGDKASFVVLEDNDPTGYKSGKGKQAKKELKISAIEFPRHSPDLNPMDFFVWPEVERRMAKNPPKKETQAQYKARLRRVAMGIPETLVRAAVMSIRKRAKMVVTAKGGDIKRD